jgi:hypothetical protein
MATSTNSTDRRTTWRLPNCTVVVTRSCERNKMPDQPQPDRFKAEMPQIPGLSDAASRRKEPAINPAVRLVAVLLAVLVLGFAASRWLLRSKHAEAPAPAPPAQIEVPAPAVDSTPAVPRATSANPEIATVAEMSKPWSSKDFFFVNSLTNKTAAALLLRLPTGSPAQPVGYWAFAMNAPFGNCRLEYLQDRGKLKDEYDFRDAKHPMVGNPCSRTVFDPLKMTSIPGDIWVRGGIAQGSDLRPPLGIQVQIRGKNILAVRME